MSLVSYVLACDYPGCAARLTCPPWSPSDARWDWDGDAQAGRHLCPDHKGRGFDSLDFLAALDAIAPALDHPDEAN